VLSELEREHHCFEHEQAQRRARRVADPRREKLLRDGKEAHAALQRYGLQMRASQRERLARGQYDDSLDYGALHAGLVEMQHTEAEVGMEMEMRPLAFEQVQAQAAKSKSNSNSKWKSK
jgi:hypothetical protein